MSAITVSGGAVQAIVRRPENNPPTDKTVLWFVQTNPSNPEEGFLRYFNSESQQWERLAHQDNWKREVFTAGNGSTEFTLSENVASSKAELSMLEIDTCGTQIYGVDFSITNNIMTFVADSYELISGDKLYITYIAE